ncbi:MAG: hypothetical protein QXG03_08510 [Halalkalicoccus sp.]
MAATAVTLPAEVLSRYPRFSLYNSPYPAHDRGCAIDLYPAAGAPSPVSGEVVDTRTVRAPPKPYAPEHDHLILVDCGESVARILHVDPAVSPGDEIEIGDSLGELVRAGFFAPWVDNHIHLGFRPTEANPYRASGSLPTEIESPVQPVSWDGTGRVRAVGETYAVLDSPAHPAPGECFAGIADDAGGTALDGGLAHYAGGGSLSGTNGPVSLLGEVVGTAEGRDVAWNEIEIRANGEAITGISLFAGRETLGAKLVRPGHDFSIGERIEVEVRIEPR